MTKIWQSRTSHLDDSLPRCDRRQLLAAQGTAATLGATPLVAGAPQRYAVRILERGRSLSLCRTLFAPFLVVALFGALAPAGAGAAEPGKAKDGPLGMKFVPLPKATFFMGWDGKKKGVKTEIKADFEIAVHTVTQHQWQTVMGNNPSDCSRTGNHREGIKDITDEELKSFPVERVSWDDTQEFVNKLNEKEAGRGYRYRLPTEAEWEYACRGGATTEEECSFRFYLDKPTNDLSSTQANFASTISEGKAAEGPYLGRPTKVGSYAPNKLGLYDMHGNVGQWCQDTYGTGNSSYRVSRGGSWNNADEHCSAARRSQRAPSFRNSVVGFRLVRTTSTADGK